MQIITVYAIMVFLLIAGYGVAILSGIGIMLETANILFGLIIKDKDRVVLKNLLRLIIMFVLSFCCLKYSSQYLDKQKQIDYEQVKTVASDNEIISAYGDGDFITVKYLDENKKEQMFKSPSVHNETVRSYDDNWHIGIDKDTVIIYEPESYGDASFVISK